MNLQAGFGDKRLVMMCGSLVIAIMIAIEPKYVIFYLNLAIKDY